jgi:hypothetical protein
MVDYIMVETCNRDDPFKKDKEESFGTITNSHKEEK